MKKITWYLWGKRRYRKFIEELQTSDIPITVEHTTRAVYSDGPIGPTTLGEFMGMKDIFVARMIFHHDKSYAWDLDSCGRLLHGTIWNLRGQKQMRKSEPISILTEDREWFERASDEAFIQAKMMM